MAAKKTAKPAEAEAKAETVETETETKAEERPTPTPAPAAHTFTKSQLIGSKKYAARRDILKSQLKEGEAYTIAQADEIINKFMSAPVKEGSED